ncbi:phenoloxidase-activating factor 3-like [Hetaerina americana]|uniref:phenoloxidase-activating factor 3-like n=1 Tax=Hetaerina americana TaxID=62018 RepID=UPI003A7F246D
MTSKGVSPQRNPAFWTAFLGALLFYEVFAMDDGAVCTNPEGLNGTCIGIRSCTPLFTVLQTKPLSSATVEFLRKSQCGSRDRSPLVCCPPDARPPEATVEEDVSTHPNLGLLRRDICGPNQMIQNFLGWGVHLMDLPWMALLAYTVQSGSPFKCGGTLISERYILTAAHCVTGLQSETKLVSVRLGEHNLTSSIDCENDFAPEETFCAPPPQDVPVEKVIPHPGYVGVRDIQNDIALIRLSRPINFTDESVQPICLPIGQEQQTQDLIGKRVTVSGWGATMQLPPSPVIQRWRVPVEPLSLCNETLRGVVSLSEASQLCVREVRNEGNHCSGDAGSPLIYEEEKTPFRFVQHGILSNNPPRNCGSSSIPKVYTRVGHFMKWILDTMEP